MTNPRTNAPLAPLTTMRVGGPADALIIAETTSEVIDAVAHADRVGEELFILGGGSNVVIADSGFAGTVVHVATRGIDAQSATERIRVRVAAGEVWDDVAVQAVAQGWSGIEALCGIPGSAGATPVQNVGAYGQEVAHTIIEVLVYDRDAREVRTLSAAECEFSYRHSLFKRSGRFVVLEVVFNLELSDLSAPIGYADLARGLEVEVGDRVPLADAREAVLAQRRRRGMVLDDADHDTWSCGSFFTNPILRSGDFAALRERAYPLEPPAYPSGAGQLKTSAAWLIEHAGFGKGYGLPGPAALSTKHTLAITNRGGASANDVVQLARTIRAGVNSRFGVQLEREPILVGHHE